MMCNRHKKEFIETESHHVWCKFMDNSHGYTWKHYPNRFELCLPCHKALHRLIIIPILNRFARTLKSNGSEYWLWMQISPLDKEAATDAVCEATLKFVLEYEDVSI